MSSVDPSILRDVCLILLSLVGVVCLIINTLNGTKRRPHVDVDLSNVTSRLAHVETSLITKQDESLCNQMHESLNKTLRAIEQRQERHEEKISKQIGGVHESIKAVFGEVRELVGQMKARD